MHFRAVHVRVEDETSDHNVYVSGVGGDRFRILLGELVSHETSSDAVGFYERGKLYFHEYFGRRVKFEYIRTHQPERTRLDNIRKLSIAIRFGVYILHDQLGPQTLDAAVFVAVEFHHSVGDRRFAVSQCSVAPCSGFCCSLAYYCSKIRVMVFSIVGSPKDTF